MYMRRCANCGVDKDKQLGYILRRWSISRICRECELNAQEIRRSSEYRRRLLETVLEYASLGLRVMPLHTPIFEPGRVSCSCKQACQHLLGKHPRILNDVSLASSDPQIITDWWTLWPDANVAISTGHGLALLDLDPQTGWRSGNCPVPLHSQISVTTGYGSHLYFKTNLPLVSQNRFVQGLDLRADNGYAVAPPSVHHSGAVYSWDSPFDFDKLELLPDFFYGPSSTAMPFLPYTGPESFQIWEKLYREVNAQRGL